MEEPREQTEEETWSVAKEPAEEAVCQAAGVSTEEEAEKMERQTAGETPSEKPEVPPELPPAVQSRLDSVLQRLEACSPDHIVRRFALDSRQLSEDVMAVCKLLGYGTREEFLSDYGYWAGSRRRSRPAEKPAEPEIATGREAEPSAALKRKTSAVLRRLGELYPDHVIPREMEQEYRGIFPRKSRRSRISGLYRRLCRSKTSSPCWMR